MDDERERLSLENIKDGALIEQWAIAFAKVLDNISDINTTDKPREIHLVTKITPNEDRTFLEITAGVKTKLAGQATVMATADLSVDDKGRAVAYGRRSRQLDLPFNVTKLNERKADND